MKAYLAISAGIPLLLVSAIAGTNYLADPYLIHQWQTPQVQRLRQPVEKLNAWGKTYAMARYRPQIIYLGNSRTELGLAVPRTADQRVFNAALSGATIGDALRMLNHAQQVADIRQVIWGIDAPSFTLSVGNSELENDLLAQDEDYLARRILLDLRRAVSLDMTRDSLAMLTGSVPAVCRPSLALFGQRDGACIRRRIEEWGGTSKVVAPRTRDFLRGEGPSAEAFEPLERALRHSCNVQWRLYINPTHAMTIDVLYWAGKGDAYEAWLAQLAALGQRVRAAGCDVRIYDFSGFNSVTTEAVPRPGDKSEMLNYWETSHYREPVGAAILARLAGGDRSNDSFGAELLPETIEEHIRQLRASRLTYLGARPFEAGEARRIAKDHARGL